MLSLPVCPVDVCPFARKISRLDGAVGWLSHQLCGRQEFDPPCPVTKQQAMVLERAYGCIEDLPVISYAGTAVLTAAPARRLRFLDPPIGPDELWILCNWARHFSQRNVSWAVIGVGKRFSLIRVL